MTMAHSEGGASRKILGGVLASVTAALASIFLLFGDVQAAFISSSATVLCTEATGLTRMTSGTVAFLGKGITLISRTTHRQAVTQTMQHMRTMEHVRQPASVTLSEQSIGAASRQSENKNQLPRKFASAVIAARSGEPPARHI